MKPIVNLTLVICLLLVYVGHAVAQDATQGLATTTQSNTKTKTKIKTVYDASKDATQVFIPLMTVSQVEIPAASRTLQMTVYYSFPGQTFVKPNFVTVGFFSKSTGGAEFADKNELIVMVDNVRLNLGKLETVQEDFAVVGPPSGMISPVAGIQVLSLSVPVGDFLRIAEAKEVKVQAGDTKFKLSSKYLEAIRELANLVRP